MLLFAIVKRKSKQTFYLESEMVLMTKHLPATVWVSGIPVRFRHELLTHLKRDHFQPNCLNLVLCVRTTSTRRKIL